RDDRGVGGGGPGCEALELLHEARFREARWWLGEVLVRSDLTDLNPVAPGKRRDGWQIVHGLPFLGLATLEIESVITVEDQHRAGGAQQVPAEIEVHDGDIVHRRVHLRS